MEPTKLMPCTSVEAFSPGVEKKLCRFFESKTFGVCNAFLHTKLEDQLETWHSKTLFDRGAECL